MKTHLNDLKWTICNLIHLLLGDEKRMSNADWFYYIAEKMESHIEELREYNNIEDDNFYVYPNVVYVIECLKNKVYLELKNKIYTSNKEYNSILKIVGESYARKEVENKVKIFKGLN